MARLGIALFLALGAAEVPCDETCQDLKLANVQLLQGDLRMQKARSSVSRPMESEPLEPQRSQPLNIGLDATSEHDVVSQMDDNETDELEGANGVISQTDGGETNDTESANGVVSEIDGNETDGNATNDTEGASDIDEPFGKAGEFTGVGENSEGDLPAFISACVVNLVTCVFCVVAFLFLKKWYPEIYANNTQWPSVEEPMQKIKLDDSTFGWASAALYKAKLQENIETVGLDNAYLLEFTNLCMKILLTLTVPMLFVVGPVNLMFGSTLLRLSTGSQKCAWPEGCFTAGSDYLSYLSFGNVENGSPLYWMHSIVVWFVVITVVTYVFSAQNAFLESRFEWLKNMPATRAKTVLVEGIPEMKRSDDELKKYFNARFEEKVADARVARNTSELTRKIGELESLEHKILVAQKNETSLTDLEREKATKMVEVDDERSRIEAEPKYMMMGFVTFQKARDAYLALKVQYTYDSAEMVCSMPPEPKDVRWCDLTADQDRQQANTVVGYALVVGLYFLYMPLVIWISQLAEAIDMGPLQPVWEGLAPTMGLQIMVAYLPTFLVLIFNTFFVLKANTFSQIRLQNWYFWFQIVFVVLITCLGDSVIEFTLTVFTDPVAIFGILGEKLPLSTHFYMNFLALQASTHFMNFLRFAPLGKYKSFQLLYGDKEQARAAAEPEDQDYYGIGSRSARFTINMVIGIVFGTLSPPIGALCFLNFAACRLIYGYLIPFAESKKADTGGYFWNQKLNHLFVGCIIYCVLMTGVFVARARTHGPDFVALGALLYVILAWNRFRAKFNWEALPFDQIEELEGAKSAEAKEAEAYDQPELRRAA